MCVLHLIQERPKIHSEQTLVISLQKGPRASYSSDAYFNVRSHQWIPRWSVVFS